MVPPTQKVFRLISQASTGTAVNFAALVPALHLLDLLPPENALLLDETADTWERHMASEDQHT